MNYCKNLSFVFGQICFFLFLKQTIGRARNDFFNNWYMKSTKTDAAAGRERSSGMWMASYADYLKHVLGHEGGAPEALLTYA